MSVSGSFGIVRDHDDGLAEVLIELAEKAQDSCRTFGIKVAESSSAKTIFGSLTMARASATRCLFAAGKLGGLVLQTAA